MGGVRWNVDVRALLHPLWLETSRCPEISRATHEVHANLTARLP